jgi:putative heme utilization carrier protein HutX
MTSETQTRLEQLLKENPGADLEKLAREYKVSTQAVVEALPVGYAYQVAGSHFENIMEQAAKWGEIRMIVRNEAVIAEYVGSLPTGSIGHGYFNFHSADGSFEGHIKFDQCAAIYFVSRQTLGRQSHSLQFFDQAGEPMFKIFLGRDKSGQLIPEQIQHFNELREALSEP